MPRVEGPDWESTQRLRAAVEGRPGDFVIRWGRGQNKLEQLRLMQDAGLLVPNWTTERQRAISWAQRGMVVFGRKLEHTKGLDIQLIGKVGKPRRKWLESDWWSVFVESQREWRIHVVGRWVVGRGLKVQVEEPWRKALVRSRNNGWHLSHTEEPPKGIREVAKQAIKACGLGFGAVDILETQDGGFVVLEINTAPSLADDYTLAAYVRGFDLLQTKNLAREGVVG